MDHRFFRRSVYNWVMEHITHPKIVTMREMYDLDQAIKRDLGEVTRTWDNYWNHMLKDGIWADNWFVQVTALFLDMDFWIMDTTCTKKNPYFQIDGNLEDGEFCNEVLKKYFEIGGTEHITTTPYHPQSNGKAERINPAIKEYLRSLI